MNNTWFKAVMASKLFCRNAYNEKSVRNDYEKLDNVSCFPQVSTVLLLLLFYIHCVIVTSFPNKT